MIFIYPVFNDINFDYLIKVVSFRLFQSELTFPLIDVHFVERLLC
jgi:hypothetical protein